MMPDIRDNPPQPQGFRILRDQDVTPELSAFAVEVLHSARAMFDEVVREFSDAILARVEWHPADARNPQVHWGVTLYRALRSAPASVSRAPPRPASPIATAHGADTNSPAAIGRRTVGADTAYPVTDRLLADATRVLGRKPAFWGRFFTSRTTTGNVEYRHAVEDRLLAANNIRVLPIARQTNRVGRDQSAGREDDRKNAEDLLATFGEAYLFQQGGQFMIFLDVEGSGKSVLSTDYYVGWSAGLAEVSPSVTFLPCVYGLPRDEATWRALRTAVETGQAHCAGIWLARWISDAEPVAWSQAKARAVVDPGVPIIAWQYTSPRDGASIDRTLVNPALDPDTEFLNHVVLPPAT